MQNATSTCVKCSNPIRNQATEGRPDLWSHTTADPFCPYAVPRVEADEALPREKRKIRIRVEELVTYDWETEIEVHKGISQDELPAYLADNEDPWVDGLDDRNFYAATNREVLHEFTFFNDDAGYLENLATVIETYPKKIMRWLTITCPVCGVRPSADDTAHQTVGYFIGVACNGMRVVDPAQVSMDGTGWTDWTKKNTVDASRKASN